MRASFFPPTTKDGSTCCTFLLRGNRRVMGTFFGQGPLFENSTHLPLLRSLRGSFHRFHVAGIKDRFERRVFVKSPCLFRVVVRIRHCQRDRLFDRFTLYLVARHFHVRRRSVRVGGSYFFARLRAPCPLVGGILLQGRGATGQWSVTCLLRLTSPSSRRSRVTGLHELRLPMRLPTHAIL